MEPMSGMTSSKPYRNLQPRAAAAIDFNDSDEDEGLLSADYKAQRKTTQDLVDFFKSAPPPAPPPVLTPPTVEDEKKKKTLLQRLRSKKTGPGLPGGSNRTSMLVPPVPGTSSSISTGSGMTATLPNGKKYIMIAVDYKEGEGPPGTANGAVGGRRSGGGSPKRGSRGAEDELSLSGSKRESLLSNHPSIQVTTTIQEGHRQNLGSDKRRSIIIQSGGGEGSSFILDNTPFLLDNFALDTDFIMQTSGAAAGEGSKHLRQHSNGTATHQRSLSAKSGQSRQGQDTSQGEDVRRNGSKRGNKVTFNISGQPTEMDEDALSKALADRIASHKAQQAAESGMVGVEGGLTKEDPLTEIVLPKPISRKKVRHVQIQTQHCIMRPMYTQTESPESLVQDLKVKEWGTQTGTAECSTDMVTGDTQDTGPTSSKSTTTTTSTTMATGGRPNSKVASLVASLSQPNSAMATSKGAATTSTTTTIDNTSNHLSTSPPPPTSALTLTEQEELAQLRQQNTQLLLQVTSLQRDLESETRARTRTAVAMQDTRDKFEMLSAMAYKKLKEMIFQRHVLEMEVRELRSQADLQTEGELLRQQQIEASAGQA